MFSLQIVVLCCIVQSVCKVTLFFSYHQRILLFFINVRENLIGWKRHISRFMCRLMGRDNAEKHKKVFPP